jgi:hypothetical protein
VLSGVVGGISVVGETSVGTTALAVFETTEGAVTSAVVLLAPNEAASRPITASTSSTMWTTALSKETRGELAGALVGRVCA